MREKVKCLKWLWVITLVVILVFSFRSGITAKAETAEPGLTVSSAEPETGSTIQIAVSDPQGAESCQYMFTATNHTTGKTAVLRSYASGCTTGWTIPNADTHTVTVSIKDMVSGDVRTASQIINPADSGLTVSLSAEDTEPEPGSRINLNASVSGGTAPYRYKYSVLDPETNKTLALTASRTRADIRWQAQSTETRIITVEVTDSEGRKGTARATICPEDNSIDWTYTDNRNGTVTLTGSRTELVGDVILPEELDGKKVTYISAYAFYDSENLTGVTIPASVEYIGWSVFAYCSRLAEINVDPGNVNYSSAGGVLFDKEQTELICYPVAKTDESYSIPNGVRSICEEAFAGSENLTSVTIPASVEYIDIRAFAYCPRLAEVNVDPRNEDHCSAGGVLFDKEQTVLIYYPAAKKDESYSIPYGVRRIYSEAFKGCKNLTSVVIPRSVECIGMQAFAYCENLTTVTIPYSVTEIDIGAFSDCRNLTDVYYTGSNEEWKQIKISSDNDSLMIAEIHYDSVGEEQDASVPDWIYTDNWDGTITLTGCRTELIGKVMFPDEIDGKRVRSIGEEALIDCRYLTSVTIPASVEYIDIRAFAYCPRLAEVNVDPRNEDHCSVGGVLFDKEQTVLIYYPAAKKDESYSIPNGVRSVCSEAFKSCKNLTSVVIPEGVGYIGMRAFAYCENLTTVTIPYSVTEIDNGAFSDCENLADVHYTGNNEEWEQIKIAADNESLASAEIHFMSAAGIPLMDWTYTDNDDDTVTLTGCWTELIGDVILPMEVRGKKVTAIGEQAFACRPGMTSVTIPDSVTSIGDHAFQFCIDLTSVAIPDSVTSIGFGAFDSCESLTSVTIPNGVTSINHCTFQFCKSLTSITIPASVMNIGLTPFYACTCLTEINVEPQNTNFSSVDGVLFNKDHTKLIAYPAGKTEENYSVPEGVTVIDLVAFGGCENLKHVIIPEGVTTIRESAFDGCENLTSITIPASVTEIGSWAFDHCDRLTDVYYTGSREEWEKLWIHSPNEALINASIHYITP